jgi:hypothetical protein
VAEVERDKTAPPDGATRAWPTRSPTARSGASPTSAGLLISAAVGIALIESGPFGVARVLFAFGVAIVMACLPLVWAKGWTDE